jgi:hypothetical protein
MPLQEQSQTIASASAKAAPPVAVTTADLFLGMPLDKWVAVATLVYVVLQTFFLLKDRLKKRRERKDKT